MVDETETGKGRATPSRKEAEASRKKQMKSPTSRKDQAKRDRSAREAMRLRQREAMQTGDDKFLPARERGPVRRFCRDYVDRRWNAAEFLLPLLVVVLILTFFTARFPEVAFVVTFLWTFTIIITILDEVLLVRGLRQQLKARFGPDETRGATGYTVLRSSQLRRFRLPKPQIKRSEALRERY